ncbi:methyltransferase domain-containing protein [Thermococcus sp.]|uniref:methyltransferase domain-containing protein n=1 Tax=Thermococcus sp. TaxID=35749 RepID=UPI0026071C64|nr:methyltransferase domain-containing protein [Thermococcus sp.]
MGMPFDPAYASYLDNPSRRKAPPPKRILRYLLSLQIERRIAVDVGAGTGYLTIPLSWGFGKVYAVEANPQMAQILEKNLRERGVKNVEVLRGEPT